MVARLLESHTHNGQVSDEDIRDIQGLVTTLYSGEFVSFLWAA